MIIYRLIFHLFISFPPHFPHPHRIPFFSLSLFFFFFLSEKVREIIVTFLTLRPKIENGCDTIKVEKIVEAAFFDPSFVVVVLCPARQGQHPGADPAHSRIHGARGNHHGGHLLQVTCTSSRSLHTVTQPAHRRAICTPSRNLLTVTNPEHRHATCTPRNRCTVTHTAYRHAIRTPSRNPHTVTQPAHRHAACTPSRNLHTVTQPEHCRAARTPSRNRRTVTHTAQRHATRTPSRNPHTNT